MTIYGSNFGYPGLDGEGPDKIKVNVYDANGCASVCTVSGLDAPGGGKMHYVQCNYPQAGNASKSTTKSKIQAHIPNILI